MSENRKNVIPFVIAFLAGVVVNAIVAFLLIGNRGVGTKQEKQEANQQAHQETDAAEPAKQEPNAAESAK